MYYVTAEYAKKNFDELIKRAEIEACGIVIVKGNKSFILISQEALEEWGETAEMLQAQSPTHRLHPRERG